MERAQDPFSQSFENGSNEQFAMEELTLPYDDEEVVREQNAASGGGGQGGKKNKSQRPPGSNDRERQRRSDLNTNFKTLETLLELSSRTRIEKVTVLAGAIERIKQLKHENIALKHEKCIIRNELTKLTRCLQHAFRGAPSMSETQVAMTFTPPGATSFPGQMGGVGMPPSNFQPFPSMPGGGGGGGILPPGGGNVMQQQGGGIMPPVPEHAGANALAMSQALLMDQANFLRSNGMPMETGNLNGNSNENRMVAAQNITELGESLHSRAGGGQLNAMDVGAVLNRGNGPS